MEKEFNPEVGKKLLTILLAASGADIVAPAELKAQTLCSLNVEDNYIFDDIDEALNQVENKDEKLRIIKAIILTHLTPSQLIEISDTVRDGGLAMMNFLKTHPECREEADKEEIISKLFK